MYGLYQVSLGVRRHLPEDAVRGVRTGHVREPGKPHHVDHLLRRNIPGLFKFRLGILAMHFRVWRASYITSASISASDFLLKQRPYAAPHGRRISLS